MYVFKLLRLWAQRAYVSSSIVLHPVVSEMCVLCNNTCIITNRMKDSMNKAVYAYGESLVLHIVIKH